MIRKYLYEPKRVDVFGTHFSNINLPQVIEFIKGYSFERPAYICFPDSYVIVKAYQNQLLQDVLNNTCLTLPDGKPVEFYSKLKGLKNISTVSGYWLCKSLLDSELTHFFYGGDNYKLLKLEKELKEEFPNSKIKGFRPAPFLGSDQIVGNQILLRDIKYINSLKPDLIWIGISSPKQDFLMNNYIKYLDQGLMLGVGGVFNYLSGYKKISPEWIKKIGFRWLYRLIKEPARLWKKYLIGNSIFIYLFVRELFSVAIKRVLK
jgi:N-acetylglucosaminyldiphosphoundecaprenol N-acetyl-beta-D-mannosaminyltransferase